MLILSRCIQVRIAAQAGMCVIMIMIRTLMQ